MKTWESNFFQRENTIFTKWETGCLANYKIIQAKY